MVDAAIKVIETVWIPTRDGGCLAARLWLPDTGERRVPAVFEFHPYRRRDFMRGLDDYFGQRLAAAGFAYVRADIRGSGDSSGIIEGEYREGELADGEDAITWIAAQPWCSGAVGMRGISWGGFNSLLLAARAGSKLHAIVAHCASDNMYTDDAHYVGGCLSQINFIWGVQYPIRVLSPPDPEITANWRSLWLERLNAAGPIMTEWLRHQREDDYWRQGSLDDSVEALACPAYLVGGTCDGYRNAIPRLQRRLRSPVKALIGPWSHTYPDFADPAPHTPLPFVEEEIRWWQRWLRGGDGGLMDGSPIHVYVVDGVVTDTHPGPVRGRWSAEREFMTPESGGAWYGLAGGRLDPLQCGVKSRWRGIGNGRLVGLTHRYWFPYPAALAEELPRDQAADDRNSTCYDGAPLEEDLEIVGVPILRAVVRADRPVAMLAVRLNVVRSDGSSWPLTYGVMNLCHRSGSRSPSPFPTGRAVEVAIPLYFAAHRLRRGERLRIALSDQLWPLVWSPPHEVSVELREGVSQLWLPARAPVATAAEWPRTAELEPVPSTYEILAPARNHVEVDGPDGAGRITIKEHKIRPVRRVLATGTQVSSDEKWDLGTIEHDPAAAHWSGTATLSVARGRWQSTLEARVTLTASESHFRIEEELTATEAGTEVCRHAWSSEVLRDLL